MIPVKLQLQNFMAYQALETLNFTEIHLACLSGENGAGKSSILDAITWSLWGKARITQSDQLIHLGETEMEVEFSFDLSDELYRVLRRRSAAGRGKSELHFHISDAGGWRTLTEGSIRKTQAKIDRLLRLDYDTFINSAFILQGRADEFTNKTSRERKQILADILGLGIYDDYEDRAKEQVRHYQQEIKIVESQIESIDRELAQEDAYRIELANSQKEAAQLKKTLDDTEAKLTELRKQVQALQHQQSQLEDLEGRLSQAQADITESEKIVTESQQKIGTYQAIIKRKDTIEKGYQDWQTAQSDVEDWNDRLSKSTTLLTDKHKLETAVNQARTKLEADIKNGQARLADLQPKVASLPTLESELNRLDQQIASLQTLESERDTLRTQLETQQGEMADLNAQNTQLKNEMDTINSRLTQLKEAGSICPICTQPLNEDHRETVHDQFMQDGKTRGDAYRANKMRLGEIEIAQQGAQTRVKQIDRDLKKQTTLQKQQAQKQQLLEDGQEAQTRLQTVQDELEGWQKKLADQAYEVEAAAQLTSIEAELETLGYDKKAHTTAQNQVKKLAHFAEDIRQLQDAESHLTEEEERLERESARQKRLLTQTAADREQIGQLQTATKALPNVSADLTKVNRDLDQVQQDERLARSAVGAAEQKLHHVAQQAKERGNKEDKLSELRQAMGLYQELRTAFGKNGVQALLIEHTIPELEDEANRILSRMTDGRMNLQFITQRETKTGQNLVETLDIRIADEIGTRDYELYSGGEAFRVNFAIRIALSKLLARRSGAKLQTLVIDEGFGSQDAQGRERLVEAINKIQREFEKIIVITHLDDIKDAFPKQIRVQKTPNGSVIAVS
ncbi:MAG: SMC family ATPase [Chloroflexota bacterium]